MKYLITGITGSLGKAVTKYLLSLEHEIVGYSRDELKQTILQKEFPNITLYLGDVRDRDRLLEASRNVDLIFHFAALKHVDKIEANPEEAIWTNIEGTENVLHVQRMHKIRRVVLSATDKGVYPINTYGMTKGMAERLVLRNPSNVVCRYGNVLASRGSVVESLVLSLKNQGKVYLTDPNMTRFWLTLEEAAAFVVENATGHGGLKIPVMKAAPLHFLAETISGLMGLKSYEMIQTGFRPGEKMHECLQNEYEGDEIHSNTAPQFTQEELSNRLRPIVKGLLA